MVSTFTVTSILPLNNVEATRLRISSSTPRSDEGTRMAMSACLLLSDLTSTVIFLPGSSATPFPKPVMEYNIDFKLVLISTKLVKKTKTAK